MYIDEGNSLNISASQLYDKETSSPNTISIIKY